MHERTRVVANQCPANSPNPCACAPAFLPNPVSSPGGGPGSALCLRNRGTELDRHCQAASDVVWPAQVEVAFPNPCPDLLPLTLPHNAASLDGMAKRLPAGQPEQTEVKRQCLFGNFALNLPLPSARALEALSGPASKLSCPGTRPVDFRRGGLPAQAQIEPAVAGTRPFQLVCPCPITVGVLIDCLCVQGDLPACQLLTTEGNLIGRRARLAEGQVLVVAAALSPGEAPDLAGFCATPQALCQLLGKGIPSSVRRCLLHCQDGWAADDQILKG